MKLLQRSLEFQWDKGNRDKNFIKHNVTDEECEEVFFDERKNIFSDPLHSQREKRYLLIGKTKRGRLLFLVFTIRSNDIRVISARDLNRQERGLYEKKTYYSQI